MKKITLTTLLIGAFLTVPALSLAAESAGDAADAHAGGIAWFKGDVDAAFAEARATNKPLYLYWGAGWCPPCNQVKATIFNRQAFIERSRQFVAVYIDGDTPSAQKLGTRFKVRGYPSMVLFKPDGTEITRLPGEVDGARYMQVLTMSMSATRPAKETLLAAISDPASLKPNEWRLLSFYSWETDEQQIVAKAELPRTLLRVAKAAPAGDAGTRLELNALAASANAGFGESADVDKPAATARLQKALADARVARDNMDIITNQADALTQFLTKAGTPERASLSSAFVSALDKLAADTTLSKTDRLTAVDARVGIARLTTPEGPLDGKLSKSVSTQVAQLDKATTNAYERQSVINAGAHALTSAGLLDDSDKLLKAELKRSHSPYYFMSTLGANAKKRGDNAAAVDWYEQAYKASTGPATRLQWGANYAKNLFDLTPEQEPRIEKAVDSIFTELSATQDAFYERNRRAIENVGTYLIKWNAQGKHAEAFSRLQAKLNSVCAKLPAGDTQHAACLGVLDPQRLQ
jgi:thioredoxin-related protein